MIIYTVVFEPKTKRRSEYVTATIDELNRLVDNDYSNYYHTDNKDNVHLLYLHAEETLCRYAYGDDVKVTVEPVEVEE